MINPNQNHKSPQVATTGLGHIIDRCLSGKTISRHEACTLMHTADQQLDMLCQAAVELRDIHKEGVISYSRNVFLPLTTLCRNRCGYCTFVKQPGSPKARTLSPQEVLQIAHEGKQAGCSEALFSMGERPEEKHELARIQLAQLGHTSIHSYLAAMCDQVYEETGLLPHANPGSMSLKEMAELRPSCVSMGMMLENISERFLQKGMPHYACPDKTPHRRLQTLRDAGRLHIPFTTGILIGIGETPEERADALLTIRDIQAKYGHIQEVIIQNFRAKAGTAMEGQTEPDMPEMMRTLAAARLILGGKMNIQAPPNLMQQDYGTYLEAGINDWGGISPVSKDHINPEAAWPAIDELTRITAEHGCTLRERLPVYPEYVVEAEQWMDEKFHRHVSALIDFNGYVRENENECVVPGT